MTAPTEVLPERVAKRVVVEGDCWTWTGAKQSSGYGSIGAGNKHTALVHRFAWEATRGPIPADMTIDHLCRNKLCVNPEHMEVVTLSENSRRGMEAKTHCVHGHPLTGGNLAWKKHVGGYTYRVCVTCRRATQLRSYDKNYKPTSDRRRAKRSEHRPTP